MALGQWIKAFTSHAEGWVESQSEKPMSLKQVVTAPLLNALQQVRVSRVLGDDHYKRMPRVTEFVAL